MVNPIIKPMFTPESGCGFGVAVVTIVVGCGVGGGAVVGLVLGVPVVGLVVGFPVAPNSVGLVEGAIVGGVGDPVGGASEH